MTNANIATINQNASLDNQQALPDLLQDMVGRSLKNLNVPEMKVPESGLKTADLSQVAKSGEQGMLAAREFMGSGSIYEVR